MVLEDFDFDSPKTKQYINILKNLGLTGRKSLMVLADVRPNVFLSLRNIPKTNIALVNNLNTYSILNSGTLILSESAAKSFTDN
jgi:large subunit ribosomal protein L4